jgi:DNA helicase-2/ATP-dependent DNA helicase PcrA
VERKYVLRTPARLTSYRVDYDRELNDEQREVVLEGTGPILVIAGAGSGKTRTLVYRVSRLIESGHDPSRILLLTFTNRAAREMLRRVESLLAVDTRRLMGGTFHSVGNRLLRRFGSRLGLGQNFTILDPEDAREMLEAATSDKKIPTLERRFPKGDVLLDLYSYTINTGRPFTEVLAEHAPHFSEIEAEIVSVFQRYRERKRLGNACDYDDLLLMWKRLLDESPEAAAQLAASYDYILVDEYQDTNRLQGDIVDGMAKVKKNVTVVGDDAQAIYSFRGASFENILGFPKRYPEAKTFRLTRNYRSTPEILASSCKPRGKEAGCPRSWRCRTSRTRRALRRSASSSGTTRGRSSRSSRSSTAPTTRHSSSRSSSRAAGSLTRSARARGSSSSATSRTSSRSCASS